MQDDYKDEKRLVYDPKDFMALSGLCKTAVYQGIERGEIPSIRIGRRILIPKVVADAMLKGE